MKTRTCIGKIGYVINPQGLTKETPVFINNLSTAQTLSMLHFEMFRDPDLFENYYSVGNFFVKTMLVELIDPTPVVSPSEKR